MADRPVEFGFVFTKPKISERLRALAAEQQLTAETAARAGLVGDSSTASSCRAAWQLLNQQPNFGAAALHMQQAAMEAQQSAHANTLRLLYDQRGVHAAHKCLRLERQAGLLDAVLGGSPRPYNRLQPRYAL